MSIVDDILRALYGIEVGDGTPGDKSIWFKNGDVLELRGNPSDTRTILLPDASGTLALVPTGPADDQQLKDWAEGEAFELTAVTYQSTRPSVPLSATVKWPDGSAGTLTVTATNAVHDAVDAFTVSHTGAGRTVTQPAVTRNGYGRVTVKPALTVA